MFYKGILQNMGGGVTTVAATSPSRQMPFFLYKQIVAGSPIFFAGLHIGAWV